MVDLVALRLGFLTISPAAAVWALTLAARAAARQGDDYGSRQAFAGSLVAVPYAADQGGQRRRRARRGPMSSSRGDLVPCFSEEGVPLRLGSIALGLRTRRMVGLVRVARTRGNGTPSRAAHLQVGRRAGVRGRARVRGRASRGTGRLRRRDHVGRLSGRAVLYVGHGVLLAPNQAMWILSPAMGGCVAVRVEGRSRDVLCLSDRIPRAADPATWMLSEIGRVRGHRRSRPPCPRSPGSSCSCRRRRSPSVSQGSAAWPGRQPARLRSAPGRRSLRSPS